MSIKIAALSDLHGNLNVKVPPCNACVIAGDLCPWKWGDSTLDQVKWLQNEFAAWAAAQPTGYIIVTWGNHDWVGEKTPHLVPKLPRVEFLSDTGQTFTHCTGPGEFKEYSFWGTPWQPPFYDWAFNLPEAELARKWAMIPDQTDVLVCHGPPRGYGDLVPRRADHKLQENELLVEGGVRVGSASLLERIKQMKPRLVVFGHVHEGFGYWHLDHPDGRSTILANVSVLDSKYRLVREPTVFYL